MLQLYFLITFAYPLKTKTALEERVHREEEAIHKKTFNLDLDYTSDDGPLLEYEMARRQLRRDVNELML